MGKKIWIWNHYATEMFKNQGGRHYWFAQNLIKRGYDVTIFSANTYHSKNDYIDTGNKIFTVDNSSGVKFVFIKTPSAIGNGYDRIKNMSVFYKNLFPVSKVIAREYGTPDIIIASSVHPLTMLAGIQIAKKLKVRCICEVRDLWPEAIFSFGKLKEKSLLGKILTNGEHWIYKKADALIFTKEGDSDYILEKKWDLEQGGDIDLKKIFYINNGLDVKAFNNSVDTYILNDEDLNSEKFNIVYVGSIRPVNNVNNIIETAKLMKNNSEFQFLIYGEGNQKADLEEKIKKENLDNVKMKGGIQKKYIPYVLSKSSVNLLNYSASKYNWSRGNSSNKLFEYLASGKPIISNIKMGYSLFEKYNFGIELEEDTPQAMATAIQDIRNLSPEINLEIQETGKKLAEKYDFTNLTDELIKVIDYVSLENS